MQLKCTGPSNFEQFDVQTTWNSNKKFDETPVLELEQKLKNQAKNHVLGHMRSCSVTSPMTGSVSISQIHTFFKRFIFSLSYFYNIFNNTHS
jgi:hypothetical protein